MKSPNRRLVVVLLIGLLMALQGCVTAPAAPPAPPAAPTAVPTAVPQATAEPAKAAARPPLSIEAFGAQFPHLSTLWMVTGAQWATLPWITMGLGYLDVNMALQPALAERWEASPDAKTWTFYIRPQAVWSDGQPVTAMDAKLTYELMLSPKTGATSFVADLMNVKGAKDFKEGKATEVAGIVAVNDKTVRFDLESGNAVFWVMAKFPLMPYHILKDVPAEKISEHPFVDNPTPSNGPFKFVKREIDQYIELERWQDWWGNAVWGPVGVDRLLAVDLENSQTALARFEAGELAAVRVPLDEVKRVEALSDVKMECVPAAGPTEFMFNHQRLNDVRWLQAFDYALDKDAINEAINLGRGQLVATTIIGPDWAINPNVKPRPHDPEKAKALLKEANWDPNRVVKFYAYNDDQPLKLAAIFQESLANIGVKMEVIPFPASQDGDILTGDKWEVFFMGGGELAIDPNVSASYFTTSSVWSNDWQDYLNPELDKLFAEGVALSEPAQRAPIYFKIQEILHNDLPWLTLFRAPVCWAVHPSQLTGFAGYGGNESTHSLLDWKQP